MDLINLLEDDISAGSEPVQPSVRVAAFLERLESADPNAPDISEDDTNACWGHQQFTAGDMRCQTVLVSWHEIGALMACKLVAVAIKTCKVARHICFERGIESASYLSDAYLQNIVELLWSLKEKATVRDIQVSS
jgi:hypothetical protein